MIIVLDNKTTRGIKVDAIFLAVKSAMSDGTFPEAYELMSTQNVLKFLNRGFLFYKDEILLYIREIIHIIHDALAPGIDPSVEKLILSTNDYLYTIPEFKELLGHS